MTNAHLSDDRIQEILDELASRPGRPFPAHVLACPFCRERVDQYQRLYAGLAADPGFALPPAFADALLNGIPPRQPAVWHRPAARIALVAGASTLVLAGLSLFVDLKPLAAAAARIGNSFAAAFRLLSAPIQQLQAGLHSSFGLLILGGLGLLVAAVFDQILQHQVLRRSR
jgi:hypothetical protein